MLRWRAERLEAEVSGEIVEPIGFDVTDQVWDVDWLEDLRDVPKGAVWPRFMSAPHPDAVGSYGGEIVEWAHATLLGHGEVLRDELRWWQQLVLRRLCEVDAAGRHVWPALVLTVPRQLGKSTLLRVMFLWRLHHADRFGEEQALLHVASKESIVQEVMRPAMRWAARLEPKVHNPRVSHGEIMLELNEDGSRWLGRAKSGVEGISATSAAVDEAWAFTASLFDEEIEPTTSSHRDPWNLLISTAKSSAKSLMRTRRAAALASIGAPSDADLLLEWSAPRLMPFDDEATWRMASAHWDDNRERLMRRKVKRALVGEVDPDDDEPDPITAIETQYLNRWPVDIAERLTRDSPLLPEGAWAACRRAGSPVRRLWVAVEDNYGHGAAVAAVALLDDDQYEIDGWLCESRDSAMCSALETVGGHPESRPRLVVSKLIPTRERCERAAALETRQGLPLLRSMLAAGRIVHDETSDLEEQIQRARVREISGGLGLVTAAGERSDLVRAMTWALHAATVRRPEPAIR